MMTATTSAPANDYGITDPFVAHLAALWTVSDETKARLAACKAYDDYKDMIGDYIGCRDSHSNDTFLIFYGLRRYIPAGMYVRLACDVIYSSYHIDRNLFFESLGEALANEAPEDKAEREGIVRERMKEYIKPNGKVTLYRGATPSNYKPSSALSYSASKEKAEWFKNRNELFSRMEGTLITKDFPLNRIIWYTDAREEKEAIVISPYLKRKITCAIECRRNREKYEAFARSQKASA